MSVLDLVKDEIEKTIQSLEAKTFLADPIAGPHFSKITSVMSSAYKRHGFTRPRFQYSGNLASFGWST